MDGISFFFDSYGILRHADVPGAHFTNTSDSKFPVANMGPIWGRQDPGGPHVGPMNLTIWDGLTLIPTWLSVQTHYKAWDDLLTHSQTSTEKKCGSSKFIPHITRHMITYPCCESMLIKGASGESASIRCRMSWDLLYVRTPVSPCHPYTNRLVQCMHHLIARCVLPKRSCHSQYVFAIIPWHAGPRFLRAMLLASLRHQLSWHWSCPKDSFQQPDFCQYQWMMRNDRVYSRIS